MRKIPSEVRSLLAFYLVFAVCLCGIGSEIPQASVAAVGPLRRAAGGSFAAAMAATLSHLGFLPAIHRGALRPTIPATSASAIWRARDPTPEPAMLLARAGGEIASLAEETGGRLYGAEWRRSGGRLGLDLELEGMAGEGVFFLSLEAEWRKGIRPVPANREELPPLRPSPPERPIPPARPPRRPGPRVAVILDDVGDVDGLAEFLALPLPLTIAVMPKRRYSEICARMAAAAGRQVILHLPLEAISGLDPGPGTIRTGWTKDRIREQLEEDLASVPGAVGANNHMGSLGTADEALMRAILGILKEKGLFFLDSRTYAASVATRVAGEIGLSYAVNGKFLDPDGASGEHMQELFRELIAAAKKKGKAVGICHANRPHTLSALRAAIPEFAAAGVEVVPLGEIVGK